MTKKHDSPAKSLYLENPKRNTQMKVVDSVNRMNLFYLRKNWPPEKNSTPFWRIMAQQAGVLLAITGSSITLLFAALGAGGLFAFFFLVQ